MWEAPIVGFVPPSPKGREGEQSPAATGVRVHFTADEQFKPVRKICQPRGDGMSATHQRSIRLSQRGCIAPNIATNLTRARVVHSLSTAQQTQSSKTFCSPAPASDALRHGYHEGEPLENSDGHVTCTVPPRLIKGVLASISSARRV